MPPINTTEFLIKFGVEKAGAIKAQEELRKLSDASLKTAQQVDDSFRRVGQSISVSTKSTKDGTVEVVKNTQVLQNSLGVQQKVTDSVEVHEDAMIKNNDAMRSANQVTQKLTGAQEGLIASSAKLAIRALAVVPIWMAIRSIFSSTIGTFNDTVNSFIEIDKVLASAKNEFLDLNEAVDVMDDVKNAAVALSLETGISVSEAVKSFRLFKSANIEAADSIKAMQAAVKGSVATDEDLTKVTNTIVDLYSLMGSTITQVTNESDKFEFIMASIASLLPTNVLTMGQFADSLTNFTGTAKTAGLTLDQLLTLVATAGTLGQRGARLGSQLSSAFGQLSAKSTEIAEFLDIGEIDVNNIKQFDLFVQILEKANKMTEEQLNVNQDIQEIFGAKGGKAVKAYVAELKILTDEYQRLINLPVEERQQALNQRYENSIGTLDTQLKILKQTREELGRTFLEGISGAEGFSNVIKDINKILLDLKPVSSILGEIVAGLIKVESLFVSGATAIPRGTFLGVDLLNTISLLNQTNIALEKSRKLLINSARQQDPSLRSSTDEEVLRKILTERAKAAKEEAARVEEVTQEEQKRVTVAEQIKEINKSLLDSRLDQLKSEGALTSELLRQEIAYRVQLKIGGESRETILKTNEIVGKRIELERAITEEKRLQNRLGNDSIKLFEIAKTEGTRTAQILGEVLSGQRDFSTFVRTGGKELDIFKREFADKFEQQQAQFFFKGLRVPGEDSSLRGGRNIPIQEEALRKPTSIFDAQLELQRQRFQGIESADPAKERRILVEQSIQNNTPITVNFTISDLKDLAINIEAFVAGEIPKIGSKINKALTETLAGKQSVGGGL